MPKETHESQVERIKRLTITALVSDDDLLDLLVLKGANAIEHTGLPPIRRSIDVDFSIDGTLQDIGGTNSLEEHFQALLEDAFHPEGFSIFDVRLKEQPPDMADDVLGEFWSGYKLEFKVLETTEFNELSPWQRSARAISLGKADRKAFCVDLSKHEFCRDKALAELDGYDLYVYSPQMIVCEKIRAVCQQMDEYRDLMHSKSKRPRAKDFFDIYYVVTGLGIEFGSDDFWNTLVAVFDAKKVPVRLLGKIDDHREFHRDSFEAVRDTVDSEYDLGEYDFYFDFLLDRLAPLEPRWNK